MLRNVSTDLIIYGKVEVTAKVASQLKTTVDHLITLAKRGDLHARRQAAAYVRDVWANKEETQTALQKLFNEIGPRYADRNGGYTRALKLGNRRGDNAPMCIVELV
jgi:large subunit ribosomal protein L17